MLPHLDAFLCTLLCNAIENFYSSATQRKGAFFLYNLQITLCFKERLNILLVGIHYIGRSPILIIAMFLVLKFLFPLHCTTTWIMQVKPECFSGLKLLCDDHYNS